MVTCTAGYSARRHIFDTHTLPPNTSSPMIRHAAVWMVREPRSSTDAMILEDRPLARDGAAAAEVWPKFGRGRDRWRASWDTREIISAGRYLFTGASWHGYNSESKR